MTREERIEKLRHLITCMKCKVSGKPCDSNCPTQYDAGHTGEIIENLEEIAKALEQEPCEDVVSRNAIIQTLNNMDRYVANELILCDTNNKFPQNEVFIVDDVYEQIAEQLPSVTPKQQTCEDCISRQAAIDALDCINGAEEVLRALPSVQPDGIPLEWIDKHLEWLDNCDNDFAQLAKVSIKAMVELWKKDRI